MRTCGPGSSWFGLLDVRLDMSFLRPFSTPNRKPVSTAT